MEIASMDFVEGLKLEKIKVAPMEAVVELANPPKEFLEAVKKDKLVVQNITVAVFKQLEESKTKVRGALTAFDDKFKPSGDKQSDDAEVDKLNSVCAQICQAQKGLAEAVAIKKWQEYVSRNEAWKKYQIKFACKIALTTIGLAASIATAAATGGATAVAVLGMANKVYTLGKEIHKFAQEIGKLEESIVDEAGDLAKRYGDPKVQKMDWKSGVKEIAAALGAPFVKGTSTLADDLKDHKAKLGQLGAKAEGAYDQAKAMMDKLDEMEKKTKGTALADKAKAMGKQVDALLEKVSSLNGKVEEGETFNAAMTKMNEQFIAKRDPKLGPLKKAVEYAKEAEEVAGLAQEVLDLAKALA